MLCGGANLPQVWVFDESSFCKTRIEYAILWAGCCRKTLDRSTTVVYFSQRYVKTDSGYNYLVGLYTHLLLLYFH